MTRRDRISIALRRLRNPKVEQNVAHRTLGARHNAKEVVVKRLDSSQQDDIQHHWVEQLDGIYDPNEKEFNNSRR